MTSKYITNVALVGAGGRSGKFMVDALIQQGQHRITAITRPNSTNSMPSGIHHIKRANYDNHDSLVEALKGQEVLVITMNNFAPKDSQTRLVDAAVAAGVKWIIPNEWGIDVSKEDVGQDTGLGPRILDMRRYIETVGAGNVHWIGVCCSFWYEFSLAGSEARYGFDFENKKLTLFDEGSTKINTTTFAQVARAVASLLSLKIRPENENDKDPHLSQYANSSIYISSFFVNQRDMFDAVLRVTGDSENDWTISHEDVKGRYQRGAEMSKEGKLAGYVIMLYSRAFYADGSGDINAKLHNGILGLPNEDFVGATKVAVQMAEAKETNMPR